MPNITWRRTLQRLFSHFSPCCRGHQVASKAALPFYPQDLIIRLSLPPPMALTQPAGSPPNSQIPRKRQITSERQEKGPAPSVSAIVTSQHSYPSHVRIVRQAGCIGPLPLIVTPRNACLSSPTRSWPSHFGPVSRAIGQKKVGVSSDSCRTLRWFCLEQGQNISRLCPKITW